jgi:hypothetical protein
MKQTKEGEWIARVDFPKFWSVYDPDYLHKNFVEIRPTDVQIVKWLRDKQYGDEDFKRAVQFYPGRDYIMNKFNEWKNEGQGLTTNRDNPEESERSVRGALLPSEGACFAETGSSREASM